MLDYRLKYTGKYDNRALTNGALVLKLVFLVKQVVHSCACAGALSILESMMCN